MALDLDNTIVRNLVSTRKWSDRAAALGVRANFHCEYCDRFLLENAENYKGWQEDHIVPVSKGGDVDDPDNIAVSCRECNVNFKSRWDPRQTAGDAASRGDLIAAVRAYVKQQRDVTNREVCDYRKIVGFDS